MAKRERFLEAISEGYGVGDARVAADIQSDAAYRYHRRKFPDWAAAVDAARARAKVEGRTLPDESREPKDFSGFVQKWFPDRRPHMAHQIRIANELEVLRPREVAMFLLWPEAGKTATLEDYLCRKLTYDPGHRFRYVSESTDLAERIVGTVKRRFTDQAEYGPFIARHGPFYEQNQEKSGKPWTTKQITIAKNSGAERDRNLVASSWKSVVYGSRIDTLILDDLCSQNNYGQSEEIFRRIRGTFFNRGIELRTLIIGTRIGPGDFYERMLDAGLVTKQIILSAADINGDPKVPEYWDREVFHDGGPCCMGFRIDTCPRDGSKLTPREFMELMRHQSGEETWWASYMQNPRSDARSTFAAYLDRCFDHNRAYGERLSA